MKKKFNIPEYRPCKTYRDKKCPLEQSKDKNNKKNSKVWSDFRKLLRKKALKLVLDRKNYTNSAKCQICKKIAVMNFNISFRLYKDKERTQFMVFHSECAFKKIRFLFKKRFSDKLNEVLKSFDYIVEFRK